MLAVVTDGDQLYVSHQEFHRSLEEASEITVRLAVRLPREDLGNSPLSDILCLSAKAGSRSD